jgi:phage terminase small subunit
MTEGNGAEPPKKRGPRNLPNKKAVHTPLAQRIAALDKAAALKDMDAEIRKRGVHRDGRIYQDERDELTMMQHKFVAEYMIDFNATRAARRSGFSGRQGWDLLQKPHIFMEVERRKAVVKAQYNITSDRVLEEMAKLAFANMSDYVTRNEDGTVTPNLKEVPHDKMAAIAEVVSDEDKDGNRRTRVKLADKKSALDSLGRNLGLFEKDNAQQQRKQNINVIVQLVG